MTLKKYLDIVVKGSPTEKAAGNTGFSSGGVMCKLGALCFYLSSVQVDNFVLRNPHLRHARNR